MADHRWIEDVLNDLAKYCKKNGLELTHEQICNVQAAFAVDTSNPSQNDDDLGGYSNMSRWKPKE